MMLSYVLRKQLSHKIQKKEKNILQTKDLLCSHRTINCRFMSWNVPLVLFAPLLALFIKKHKIFDRETYSESDCKNCKMVKCCLENLHR